MRFGCLRGRETESGDGYEREQVAMFSRLGFLSKHRFYDQRTYEPLLYTGKSLLDRCKCAKPHTPAVCGLNCLRRISMASLAAQRGV